MTADERLCTIHKVPRDAWARCHRCDGQGETIVDDDDPGDPFYGFARCPSCGGHGGTEECPFCMEEEMDL
jgi:DnaJ-class molecular chaperone